MSTNHKKFLSRLRKSQEAVSFANRWLLQQGYDVLQTATREAPAAKNWEEFADGGDLFIYQRVEVKRLGVCFSQGNWPYGTKFIVCGKNAFDRAKPKPFVFLILSNDMQCVASVRSETRPHWYVEKKRDAGYENVEQDYYLAPLDCVKWQKTNKTES